MVFTINALPQFNTTVSLACIFKLPLRVRWMVVQSCDEKDCQNQHYCKYLFLCFFWFMFLFFSESYVKLLISTKNLEKEKEEATKKMLTQEVHIYLKYNDHSRDELCQAIKSFTDHLIDVYKVRLVTLAVASVIIILDCPTLESLDRLWSDYISGHLDKIAERYLVTDKMKKRLNLETVCLKTTITKENYFNCRKALMELSSTSSGEFKQSVWEVQLYCT